MKHQEGELIHAYESAKLMGPEFMTQLRKGISKTQQEVRLMELFSQSE